MQVEVREAKKITESPVTLDNASVTQGAQSRTHCAKHKSQNQIHKQTS